MGAAPLGGPVRRHDGRRTGPHLCVCPPPLPSGGHVFSSLAPGVHPLATPWTPPPPPVLRVLVVAVTCVVPNALSTACPPLPVRSCWCVRGHRPTLALVDGAYRLSRAKSRSLSLTITVPYIYKFYDTMLTKYTLLKWLPLKSLSSIPVHMCTGLTAARPPMVTINQMCHSLGQIEWRGLRAAVRSRWPLTAGRPKPEKHGFLFFWPLSRRPTESTI